MPAIDHQPGRTFFLQGKEWLYFSGTAYLGMGHVAEFRDALIKGVHIYGTHFGGSRRSNLTPSVFAKAEEKMAEWVGTEAALTTSSGSLAGQLLLRFLREKGSCHFAPNVHPALTDGDTRLAYASMTDWSDQVMQILPAVPAEPIQLVCSSVDPLKAGRISFDWLSQLPTSRSYRLIVDDSHGLGVLGENGEGILPTLPDLPHVEYVIVGSLAKAPGLPGGAVFGSRSLINELWGSPFFIGASPMTPAYLYAWLQTRSVIRRQLDRLRKNVHYLEQHWPDHVAVRHQSGYPVFYLPYQSLAGRLEKYRMLISSFPYPAPEDPVVNRVVVSALHKHEDLDRLLAALYSLTTQDL